MLPTKHVILRRVETRRRRGGAGSAAAQSAARITVEVDALTARRAAEVSRHSDVEAVAPGRSHEAHRAGKPHRGR